MLVPSPSSTEADPETLIRNLVIKEAKSKLRLKKPSRIFVHGGHEISSSMDWRSHVKDDTVLLISSGEDYVGPRTDSRPDARGVADPPQSTVEKDLQCSIEVLANETDLDPLALKQLESTAHALPGIIHAVAQPDLHRGTKYPIGAVFVSQGWIHPPLIGSDIGCGMAWYRCNLHRDKVEGDKGRRIAEHLRGLEGPWRTQEDREAWLSADSGETAMYSAGAEWDASLGTIGAGNHFAELQIVEKSSSSNPSDFTNGTEAQVCENEVVLLVHSGSRGYGSDILKTFTANGQTSIPENHPDAQDYISQHNRACHWASLNRDLIALRFLSCLEPGDAAWELGNSGAYDPASPSRIRAARDAVQSRKVVDIWHNNVEKTTWPPPPLDAETHSLQEVYIHRKGAAPVYNPRTRLPLQILPLPGSRATPTLIIHPTLTPNNHWGLLNALSLAHGAGRAMSRAKAAEWIAAKYNRQADLMLRGDVNVKPQDRNGKKGVAGSQHEENGGTWVVCEDKNLVWEEAPEAYKDIWRVGGDLVDRGVAEMWGWCRPVVSYKIRNE
ncbi:MAG: hypothetical protein Q9190_005755 [Brigantiaea leucoxantha]